MSETELLCDCHEDAKPLLREADKLPWPHPLFIRCDRCGAEGEARETADDAKLAWVHCDRINEDGSTVGVMKKGKA